MLPLSTAAIFEKNRLASSGAWILLCQITLTDGTVIRVCQNDEDVIWNGEQWVAFPFEIDVIGFERKGEIPRAVAKVSNVTRAIEGYLQSGGGGVGSSVWLAVVHSDHLDLTEPEIEADFICTSATSDAKWATFSLGAPSHFRRRVPQCRIRKNNCRFRFKSTECGYSGTETDCDKTLAACRSFNNSVRYGGFPGIGSGSVYV